MKEYALEREQVLPVSREAAWDFFSDPRNLAKITPPEMGFEVLFIEEGPMYESQEIVLRVRVAPFVKLRWVTEIREVVEGREFVDLQKAGPYKFWHHRHTFEEVDGGVRMRDEVRYAIGWGWFGELAHRLFVRGQLERIFDYRHEVLKARFGRCLSRGATPSLGA